MSRRALVVGAVVVGAVLVIRRKLTRDAAKLRADQSNQFGVLFDQVYEAAVEEAEANWDLMQRALVADLGTILNLENLEELNTLRSNYIWYYSEHATRGAWLQWMAFELSLMGNLGERNEYLPKLFREHREAHRRLSKVRKDLHDHLVPDFLMHVTFRDTLAPVH